MKGNKVVTCMSVAGLMRPNFSVNLFINFYLLESVENFLLLLLKLILFIIIKICLDTSLLVATPTTKAIFSFFTLGYFMILDQTNDKQFVDNIGLFLRPLFFLSNFKNRNKNKAAQEYFKYLKSNSYLINYSKFRAVHKLRNAM